MTLENERSNIMKKKKIYDKPVIEVIAEEIEHHLLAGSTPTNNGFGDQDEPSTGTNGGSNSASSATGEATGHIHGGGIAGSDYGAKGWIPVGEDVLDSL